MRTTKKPSLECDRRILLIVFALMLVGVSFVGSASSYFSAARFDDPYYLLKKHIVRVMIACFFLLVAVRIDYIKSLIDKV